MADLQADWDNAEKVPLDMEWEQAEPIVDHKAEMERVKNMHSPDELSDWATKHPNAYAIFGDLEAMATADKNDAEWIKNHPNLSGIYGVGKSFIESLEPVLGMAGATGAQIVAPEAPIMAPALGYGAGADLGRVLTEKYMNIGKKEKQPESSLGEQGLKTAKDVAIMAAGGKIFDIGGKLVYGAEDKITNIIKEGVMKGIKPSISGKGSQFMLDSYIQKVGSGVKSVLQRTDLDPSKLPVKGFVEKFGESIGNAKRSIWNESRQLIGNAKSQGLKTDLAPAYNNIKIMSEDPQLLMVKGDLAKDIKKIKLNWDKAIDNLISKGKAQRINVIDPVTKQKTEQILVDPEFAEGLLAKENAKSKPFWNNKNRSEHNLSEALTATGIANDIRKSLENTFPEDSAFMPLRKEYGALSAFENDVTARSIVEGRRNAKGFFDLANIWGTGRFIAGVATMNPAMIIEGVGEKFLANRAVNVNLPSYQIKKMMIKAEKEFIKKNIIPKRNPYISRVSGKDWIGENTGLTSSEIRGEREPSLMIKEQPFKADMSNISRIRQKGGIISAEPGGFSGDAGGGMNNISDIPLSKKGMPLIRRENEIIKSPRPLTVKELGGVDLQRIDTDSKIKILMDQVNNLKGPGAEAVRRARQEYIKVVYGRDVGLRLTPQQKSMFKKDLMNLEDMKLDDLIDTIISNSPQALAERLSVKYSGKMMGLHHFKDPITGANFSLPENNFKPEIAIERLQDIRKNNSELPIDKQKIIWESKE